MISEQELRINSNKGDYVKKQILTVLSVIVLTTICLFTLNYFTLIGLKMPHRVQIIYTWKYPDIFARATPQFLVITNDITGDIDNEIYVK